MTTIEELREKRDTLRGLQHDIEEWRSNLSDERRQLEEAQLRGDWSLATVEHIRFLGGQQVDAQRRRILIGNQLDEVNEQLSRIGA